MQSEMDEQKVRVFQYHFIGMETVIVSGMYNQDRDTHWDGMVSRNWKSGIKKTRDKRLDGINGLTISATTKNPSQINRLIPPLISI